MGKVLHRLGDIWHLPEGRFVYVQETQGGGLILDRIGGKETLVRNEDDLEAMRSRRVVRRERPNLNARGAVQRSDDADEIGPEGASDRALSLAFFTRQWDDAPSAKSTPALNRFVADRAAEARRRGIRWLPSAGALRRALADRGEIGRRPMRVMQDLRGKTSRRRWAALIEDAIRRAVAWFYAYRNRDFTDAHAYLSKVVHTLNRLGKRRHGLGWRHLPTPHYETLRRHIRAAEDLFRLSVKLSPAEARRRLKATGRGMEAKAILDVVMIDATVLDGWCVLDDRFGRVIPVGRPTVTIALDLHSRCILGVVITYEGESLYAVMACLQQVVSGKHAIIDRLPQYAELLEDLYGLPDTLVVDNAWRQTGVSFQDACEDVGISVEWAPVRNPEYKAHVESFWTTLNKLLVHKLPGAVPHSADLMRKLGLDPKETATLTLSALEDLIYRAIYDVYHGEPHSGTMLAPLVAWRRGLEQGREVLDDLDFLAASMGTVDTATLDRQGIRFKECRFHDPDVTERLLADMFPSTPVRDRRGRTGSATAKVKIKFNPSDLTQIQVWNPKAQPKARYVSLPNWDQAYASQPGLGFWHHDRVRGWAKAQNMAFKTDEERVRARDSLRAATENAAPEAKIAAMRNRRRLLEGPRPILRPDADTVQFKKTGSGIMAHKPVDIAVEAAGPERADQGLPEKGQRRGGKGRSKTSAGRPGSAGMDRSPAPDAADEPSSTFGVPLEDAEAAMAEMEERMARRAAKEREST